MSNILYVADNRRNEVSHANRFAAQTQDPHLQMCFDYWLSKCKRQGLPSRQDIDAIEMRSFLPYVIFLQVERSAGERRFRVHLMGTHLEEIFGRDVTGLYIDQICRPETHNLLAWVTDMKHPCYGSSRGSIPDREFIEFEHLTLPLASDGARVDMLFGVRCRLRRAWQAPMSNGHRQLVNSPIPASQIPASQYAERVEHGSTGGLGILNFKGIPSGPDEAKKPAIAERSASHLIGQTANHLSSVGINYPALR